MPIIIYVFTLCSFAIGFTEFISIGLVSVLSNDLHITNAQAGMTVSFYAIGIVLGASVATPVTLGYSRKKLLLAVMAVFTLAQIGSACATGLSLLLAARLIAGVVHGIYFAVAASVAIHTVDKTKSGQALALVFGGVTIAISLGVPIGSWLGTLLPWQWVFALIAIYSFIGFLGLMKWMPDHHDAVDITRKQVDVFSIFKERRLLIAATVPFLAFTASFTLYTYISPLLLRVTAMSAPYSNIALFAYGIGSAIGTFQAGRLTDRYGANQTSSFFLISILITLLLIGILQYYPFAMLVLVTLLGCATFGAITPLQSRIMSIAERIRPGIVNTASGLNIAAFNSGVLLGSISGALNLSLFGLSSLAWAGSLIAFCALLVLLWQKNIS